MIYDATINVFLIINSELLRIAVRQVLQGAAHCNLIGEAADTSALLDHFSDGQVDVIVARRSAIHCEIGTWVSDIKSESDAKILLLLNHSGEFAELAGSGVDGFMLTDSATYLFPVAMRVLHEGGCWLSPELARYIIQGDNAGAGTGRLNVSLSGMRTSGENEMLTTKEREVIRYLNEGLTNAQIAAELKLSVETVRVHVRNILRKLGAHDRNEAVTKANALFP
jgi:DNA-binding NarL/FixJ family response regulator